MSKPSYFVYSFSVCDVSICFKDNYYLVFGRTKEKTVCVRLYRQYVTPDNCIKCLFTAVEFFQILWSIILLNVDKINLQKSRGDGWTHISIF